MYNKTEFNYPFKLVEESYLPHEDLLPPHPAPPGRPSSPSAVILTHDDREWTKHSGYVKWFAAWNFLYAQRHADVHYVYYKLLREKEMVEPQGSAQGVMRALNDRLPPAYQVPRDLSTSPQKAKGERTEGCFGPRGRIIYKTWCKVKVLRHAMAIFPSTEYFLYLDSDAVVGPEYAHLSISRYVAHMEELLRFSMKDRPVVYGQELGGSGFSMYCTNMWAANMSCFNSGVVLVNGGGDAPRRKAHKVLDRWWYLSEAATATCEPVKADRQTVPIRMQCPPYHGRWALNKQWPGEQPSIGAMYNDSHYNNYIQVSYPNAPRFHWNNRHHRNRSTPPEQQVGPIGVDCLAHFPQAHCYVQHYFAGDLMKSEESKLVRDAVAHELRTCARVRALMPPSTVEELCEGSATAEVPKWRSNDIAERVQQIVDLIEPFVDVEHLM